MRPTLPYPLLLASPLHAVSTQPMVALHCHRYLSHAVFTAAPSICLLLRQHLSVIPHPLHYFDFAAKLRLLFKASELLGIIFFLPSCGVPCPRRHQLPWLVLDGERRRGPSGPWEVEESLSRVSPVTE
jgi:hypothetical protein